jgi:hypothetical protein
MAPRPSICFNLLRFCGSPSIPRPSNQPLSRLSRSEWATNHSPVYAADAA